jgi:hypothetical protein
MTGVMDDMPDRAAACSFSGQQRAPGIRISGE